MSVLESLTGTLHVSSRRHGHALIGFCTKIHARKKNYKLYTDIFYVFKSLNPKGKKDTTFFHSDVSQRN